MNLQNWLDSGQYLPEMLRDFHDQKNLFKVLHHTYDGQENDGTPNWVNGHCYVIDWFLWYMAARGYTLQKSRKNVEFREFENWREIQGNNSLISLCVKSIDD